MFVDRMEELVLFDMKKERQVALFSWRRALRRRGAQGRTRTGTVLPPKDFKSFASAVSPLGHVWRHHPDSNWG